MAIEDSEGSRFAKEAAKLDAKANSNVVAPSIEISVEANTCGFDDEHAAYTWAPAVQISLYGKFWK